jgi:hypothetical protein
MAEDNRLILRPPRQHRTVRLRFRGQFVPIDVKMAPLIRALWKRKIWTRYCCQGKQPRPESKAYILFDDPRSASKFVGTVGRNSLLSLPAFEIKCRELQAEVSCRAWEWQIDPDWDEEGPPRMRVSVRFPQEDIPGLIKLFGG